MQNEYIVQVHLLCPKGIEIEKVFRSGSKDVFFFCRGRYNCFKESEYIQLLSAQTYQSGLLEMFNVIDYNYNN